MRSPYLGQSDPWGKFPTGFPQVLGQEHHTTYATLLALSGRFWLICNFFILAEEIYEQMVNFLPRMSILSI